MCAPTVAAVTVMCRVTLTLIILATVRVRAIDAPLDLKRCNIGEKTTLRTFGPNWPLVRQGSVKGIFNHWLVPSIVMLNTLESGLCKGGAGTR